MTNQRDLSSKPSSSVQTANKVPTILQMNDKCINFIKSGEKINDIEAVVKELIENSVDANATRIDIKIGKFGTECIEVEDNGCGIDEESLDHIGKRHYSSKVDEDQDSKDFNQTKTFGFRGEALSCLCIIANVTITTKAPASPTGTRLVFDNQGKLIKKETIGRRDGTTVIIKNLFQNLPVRRKELETCGKRQYDKIVRLIYEHVLVRPHIKFTLSKSNKMQITKDFTHGGTTLENSIIAIYGTKVMDSLVPINKTTAKKILDESDLMFDSYGSQESQKNSQENSQGNSQENPTNDGQADRKIKVEPISSQFMSSLFYKRLRSTAKSVEFRIDGYISKVGHGRNSNDAQFLFVNQKPCDVSRVSRLINEIYRSYTPNQTPFFCLFIQVQDWAADFNVPRKRAVIISEENKLCDMVHKIIDSLYKEREMSNLDCMNAFSQPNQMNGGDSDPTLTKSSTTTTTTTTASPQQPATLATNSSADEGLLPFTLEPPVRSSRSEPMPESATTTTATLLKPATTTTTALPLPAKITATIAAWPQPEQQPAPTTTTTSIIASQQPTTTTTTKSATFPVDLNKTPNASQERQLQSKMNDHFKPSKRDLDMVAEDLDQVPCKKLAIDYYKARFAQHKRDNGDGLDVKVDFPEDLADSLSRERMHRRLQTDFKRYSYAIHPTFNEVSEEQLKVNLSRQSFANMDIVGQFNRGFIIAKFNDHLFIIDQHASDERFNYEDQLERYPLERQNMVRPKPLLLTSIQENAIINNLNEFERKGFGFLIDENKMSGYRVQLVSTSICKGLGLDVHLNKADVEELINVAVESPNLLQNYTLEKVKDLAATRACRKSVMIGDSLTKTQMKNIVSKMSELKNPWACAHGRPTIRHLMDVQWMYKAKDERK